MLRLLAVVNNNIHTTQVLLRKYQKKHGKLNVQVMDIGGKPHSKADVVLISTLREFTRVLPKLDKIPCTVIVFDNPVQCSYLKPCTMLDVEKQSLSYIFNFRDLTLDSLENAIKVDVKKHIKIEREYQDIIPTLLGTQTTSVLNVLQTFLYRIKDTDRRVEYQEKLYRWLVSNDDTDALRDEIMGMGDYKKKEPKALTAIIDAFKTKESEAARSAFRAALERKATKKPISYKKLGKEFGVAPFDIRYTLHALRKFGKIKAVFKTSKELYAERRIEVAKRQEVLANAPV